MKKRLKRLEIVSGHCFTLLVHCFFVGVAKKIKFMLEIAALSYWLDFMFCFTVICFFVNSNLSCGKDFVVNSGCWITEFFKKYRFGKNGNWLTQMAGIEHKMMYIGIFFSCNSFFVQRIFEVFYIWRDLILFWHI